VEGDPSEEAKVVESFAKASLVDAEDSEEEEEDPKQQSGFLGSFVKNLGMAVVGTDALKRSDVDPSLEDLKKKLMERNVAEDIANKIVESVAASLVGSKLGSFSRVSSAVRKAMEEAVTRILTPRKPIDILRGIQEAKARGRPYVITFVGVNGVGKSTSLAKVAYYLKQHKHRIMVAACDTFRSGAVEQVRVHAQRLGLSLYARGYEKDPAKVAGEAIRAAQKEGCDVVLVDTAGRMQNNEPLMRAITSLVALNNPDLVLFVGEALAGNDSVDQLVHFNKALATYSSQPSPHVIDGLVISKFETVDEKIGTAISMVFCSGAPIVFLGVGQQYTDLRKLDIRRLVKTLLG
jgi:signal recognition particle receptor subunit alpha